MAGHAAAESAAEGIKATFSPMMDVSRDPRWGRIMESFGEDPFLSGVMGTVMVRREAEKYRSPALPDV